MTIYDAAPALMALAVSALGLTICNLSHDRAVAARDARMARETVAAE